jgi:hypothetical protein
MSATPEISYLTTHRGQIEHFLKGHKDATDFICDIFVVLHIWDDLIDKDKKLTDAEIHQAFWLALVNLPCNPFYHKHFNALQPILVNSIINWQASNKMENEGSPKDRTIAFILRGTYTDLVTMSAYIIGGRAWTDSITVGIRQWAHDESFDEYLDNLAEEKDARNVQ